MSQIEGALQAHQNSGTTTWTAAEAVLNPPAKNATAYPACADRLGGWRYEAVAGCSEVRAQARRVQRSSGVHRAAAD